MRLLNRESDRLAVAVVLAVLLAGSCVAQTRDAAGLPVVSKSVTTTEAVEIGLANSPSLEARRKMLVAASARVGMAKAMTQLRLSTSTFATAGSTDMILAGPDGVDPRNITMSPERGRLSQNFMAMYPLYTGGRFRAKVAAARAEESAASSEAASTELDVALAVKVGVRQVMLARDYVGSYQKRAEESKERVRIAEAAFEAGRIARYDLLRNRTELADAEQMLINAQRDAEVALIDLKSMMGISQSSRLALADAVEAKDSGRDAVVDEPRPSSESFAPTVPIGDADKLQQEALERRPELAAAREKVKAAEAVVGVAGSAYKPQIYATAMYDVGTTKDAGFENGYLVGIAAGIPILDGGERSSARREARAMLDQARADEREVLLQVSKDVATELANLTAATKNVELAWAAVDQAEEDYRVIRMRYEAGKSTNVEVLDALAAVTKAYTNQADALYQQRVAQDRLERAIGCR